MACPFVAGVSRQRADVIPSDVRNLLLRTTHDDNGIRSTVLYQLRWKILPGLRGLACSDFAAVPTSAPDTERGVALEFATEAERDAFLRRLEDAFAEPRFSNNAAAFEAVKAAALDWAAERR
jgi:hypothetical protein